MDDDEPTITVRQAYNLQKSFRSARGSNGSKWKNEDVWKVSQSFFLGSALDVFEGRSEIVPVESIDTVIKIDRSAPLNLPKDVKQIIDSELESLGPAEIDIKNLQRWTYPGPYDKLGWANGDDIRQYLKNQNLLKNCLGLREAIELQKKGASFFLKYFGRGQITFWKTLALFDWGMILRPIVEAILPHRKVTIGGTIPNLCFHVNAKIFMYPDSSR